MRPGNTRTPALWWRAHAPRRPLLALLLALPALASCGAGSQMAKDASWQPYRPERAQPSTAWQAVEREERTRTVQRRGADEPDRAPSAPAPASDVPQAAPPPKTATAGGAAGATRRESSRRTPPPTPPAGGDGAASGSAAAVATGAKGPATGGAKQDDDAYDPTPTGPRDVVYLGFLKLEVRRRIDAMQAIEVEAKARGGYVDRMINNIAVVRVPAGDFEGAMAAFAALGVVLDRRVQAIDVSEQMSELGTRLAIFRAARERLLALLARTTATEERLRLLEQIRRLTAQIEDIEASLNTLRDLVAWQTITIELSPQADNEAGVARRSPFAWVRELSPGRAGPEGGATDVLLSAIQGFVVIDKADPFTARAADGSAVHVFAVANEPAGDGAFWHAAISWELEGRGDLRADQGEAGAFRWQRWQPRAPRPWSWLLGVRVVGKQVWVFAAFVPDDAAWTRHGPALLDAMRRTEVKR